MVGVDYIVGHHTCKNPYDIVFLAMHPPLPETRPEVPMYIGTMATSDNAGYLCFKDITLYLLLATRSAVA
eukprot:5584829-Amphidinium_carterae.3